MGEGVLQIAPIGRHNAHHAFDFISLNDSADAINPYAIAAAIARALLGTYPVGLSVAYPRREGRPRRTIDTLSDVLGR